MTDARPATILPIYHNVLDWDQFLGDYPAPDVFEQTVYRWPQERVRDLQDRRFRALVDDAWSNPFYQRLWSGAGLDRGEVDGLADIAKLPLFNADDIKVNQQEHPPFGDIQGVTLGDLAMTPLKLQTSGGTTGKPRPTLFDPIAWEMNALTSARGLYVQGARPGDVLQVPATASLANLGWAYYKAAHDYLGMLPLTTGSGVVTPTRRQLEIAFDWGTNVWMSFPEYLVHMAMQCHSELGRDVKELKTKFICSFLGPDIDETLRNQIQNLWGCPVYDLYGTHEMGLGAFECRHRNGLHLMEDSLYFEFLDTETDEPVRLGEPGNLVVTVLHRRVPPIVRFNVRDLGRIVSTDTCECGSNFRRIDHFLGRSDEMVKLRGVNLYPMACLRAIKSDDRTTGEWLCVVDRVQQDRAPREEMTVRVEVRAAAGDTTGLQEYLERQLKTDLGVGVGVELVAEGALAEVANYRGEGKARRLLDRRYSKA